MRLVSSEYYGDIGFVVDFRLKQDSGVPLLQLRGGRGFPLVLNDAGPLKGALRKSGLWNRLEGTVHGDKVGITVNGKLLELEQVSGRLPKSGPIRLVPDGPIDFANLYVRDLK